MMDNWQHEFAESHDHFRLVGQDNLRSYVAVPELRIRVHPDDSKFEILARVAAARVAGCHITVSSPQGVHSDSIQELQTTTEGWAAGIEFIEETDEQLGDAIGQLAVDRLRYAASDRVPRIVRQAANQHQVYVADTPVLSEGRIELIWYVREKSLSFDFHRYGNLGARAEA